MKRIMLKAKIHNAVVTEADKNYEGSITLDEDLMDDEETDFFIPRVLVMDENNKIKKTKS